MLGRSLPRHPVSLRASLFPLVAVALILAAAGLAGGFLIGLNPGFTAALVVAVVIGTAALLRARQPKPARPDGRLGAGTVVGHVAIVGAATLGLSQLIPYGRTASNPAVTGEPAWSSPRTRELTVNACFGCHSNETTWPWYSRVAPMSWAVASHVEEGRADLNFSEFDRTQEADEIIETIQDGSMPPSYYTRFGLHPEAKLTPAERAELIAGLQATPGLSESGDESEGESGGESSED